MIAACKNSIAETVHALYTCPRWLLILLNFCVFIPAVSALALSFAITPDTIEAGSVKLAPPCLFKHLFDIPCPACGMTRAFCSISHGDFLRAIEYNAASILIYPLFVVVAIACLVSLVLVCTSRKYGGGGE